MSRRAERVKAEREQAKRHRVETRRTINEMKTIIKSAHKRRDARRSRWFQDFFNFLELATDEEEREWMGEPKNMLLLELYTAELVARGGGKRRTMDTHGLEMELFTNLVRLRDALWNAYYCPNRGTVHIIFDPVQREIFAAPYIDRILHHWIVGTLTKWQDTRLIFDSYSCREGKGTWFGVKRFQHHILSVSRNMSRRAYIVQLDLSGYFMHIDRQILYDLVKAQVDRQFPEDARDKRYMILLWVLGQVIFDDPTDGVRLQGSYRDWLGLAEDKSLMMQPEGRGLVIGNYTSQFFSNIYLDPLDRFVTMTLGYKHYGRYVDDFYIVVTEEELPQAKRDIKAIRDFVLGYGIKLNNKKTKITEVHKGAKFLGVVVKGFRMYPCERLVKNFRRAVYEVATGQRDPEVITSYLGMFARLDAGKIIKKTFDLVGWDYVYEKKRIRTNKQQKEYERCLKMQRQMFLAPFGGNFNLG